MKKYLIFLFIAVISTIIVEQSREPDLNLNFHRAIPSELDPIRIERNLSSTTRWPQWFHSLDQVKRLTDTNPQSIDDLHTGSFRKGSLLELTINAHQPLKKPFTLLFQVTDYHANQFLILKLMQDSSNRLTRLFDRLEWKIQIQPAPQPGVYKTLLVADVTAHTHHWRARLFGRLAEKILMNQIFYPDLIKLSELKQPFSAEIPPPPMGFSGSSR